MNNLKSVQKIYYVYLEECTYTGGPTYEELHEENKKLYSNWEKVKSEIISSLPQNVILTQFETDFNMDGAADQSFEDLITITVTANTDEEADELSEDAGAIIGKICNKYNKYISINTDVYEQ